MSYVVEAELEDKILSVMRQALEGMDVSFEGSWAESREGEVKGEESAEGAALLSVAVGALAYESFLTPIADLQVALVLSVRREFCPNAAELRAYFGAIEKKLVAWQMKAEKCCTELSSAHFRVDGIRLDPGDAPVFVPGAGVWRLTRPFAVRGVVQNW